MPNTRLRLDPWPADYDSPVQIGGFDEDADARVDTSVEGIGWKPVDCPPRARPEPIHFVDGVRRVEANVILDDGSTRLIRGLFGSVAAGAVRVENKRASFEVLSVSRFLVASSGVIPETQSLPMAKTTLVFHPRSVPASDPPAPLQGLQNVMREQEALITQALAAGSACVFADGPLNFFTGADVPVIGVVKTLHRPYLSLAGFDLVRHLSKGQRTPLFSISGKYDRYSWYLRVGTPRPMDHDIAGVLRLEVRTEVGLKQAVELAGISAACIPAFVAESFRDPRSPQNLLPIGALEHELRHRLGDPLSIRRAIEAKLFAESKQ
jgi:hypothetical protein